VPLGLSGGPGSPCGKYSLTPRLSGFIAFIACSRLAVTSSDLPWALPVPKTTKYKSYKSQPSRHFPHNLCLEVSLQRHHFHRAPAGDASPVVSPLRRSASSMSLSPLLTEGGIRRIIITSSAGESSLSRAGKYSTRRWRRRASPECREAMVSISSGIRLPQSCMTDGRVAP